MKSMGWRAGLLAAMAAVPSAIRAELTVGVDPLGVPELRWSAAGEALESADRLIGPWVPASGIGVERVEEPGLVRVRDLRGGLVRFYRLVEGATATRLAYAFQEPAVWRDVWVDPVGGEIGRASCRERVSTPV